MRREILPEQLAVFPQRDVFVGITCRPDPQIAVEKQATYSRDPLDHFSGYCIEPPLIAHRLSHYPPLIQVPNQQ